MPKSSSVMDFIRAADNLPVTGMLPYKPGQLQRYFSSIRKRLEAKAKEDARAKKLWKKAQRPPKDRQILKGMLLPAASRLVQKRFAICEEFIRCQKLRKPNEPFAWDDLEYLRAVVCAETYRPDVGDKRPLPPEPCPHRPGTAAHAEMIEQRAHMGCQLWHPDDYSLDDLADEIGLMAAQAENGAKLPAFVGGERAPDAVEVNLRGEDAVQSRQDFLGKAGFEDRDESDWYDPGRHERVYEERDADGKVVKVRTEPGKAARYAK